MTYKQKIPAEILDAMEDQYDLDLSNADPTNPGNDRKRLNANIGITFELLTLQKKLVSAIIDTLLPKLEDQLTTFKAFNHQLESLVEKINAAVGELRSAGRVATCMLIVTTLLVGGNFWDGYETRQARLVDAKKNDLIAMLIQRNDENVKAMNSLQHEVETLQNEIVLLHNPDKLQLSGQKHKRHQ